MKNITLTVHKDSKKGRIKSFLERKTRKLNNFFYKCRRPILVITRSGLIYFLFKNSFVAYAKDIKKFTTIADELTGESAIKKCPKTYLGMAKEISMSVLGLKIYWDPRATRVQKASAAGRLTCCTSAIVLGALAELSPPASYTKFVLAACCTGSWAAYTALSFQDAKDVFLGHKK